MDSYGQVDELTSAIGLARATCLDDEIKAILLETQKELIPLMGDLAVADEDYVRYEESKIKKFDPKWIERLDRVIADIEGRDIRFEGWVIPGHSLHSSALDLARTVCRRCERAIFSRKTCNIRNFEGALAYLNRLSDMLWLLARYDETSSK